jgi:hypothetical protein
MTGRIETTRRIPPLWCFRDLTPIRIETRDAGKNPKMECIRCWQSSSFPSKKKRTIDRFRIGTKEDRQQGLTCVVVVCWQSFFSARAGATPFSGLGLALSTNA